MRRKSSGNGNGNGLEEAQRELMLAQAQLVQAQATLANSHAAMIAQHAVDRQEDRKVMAQVMAVLQEHSRILAELPEFIRGKIGFGKKESH